MKHLFDPDKAKHSVLRVTLDGVRLNPPDSLTIFTMCGLPSLHPVHEEDLWSHVITQSSANISGCYLSSYFYQIMSERNETPRGVCESCLLIYLAEASR